MKYLTLNQIRQYDLGIPLSSSDIADPALSRMIAMAESDIDAYMGFDPKLGGFEPSTLMVQAQYDHKSRQLNNPNDPVPIRKILDYNIQLSNISSTGAGFNAVISPNDIAINNFDGYIEIVPLSAITYSIFPAVLDMGLDPPIVKMDAEFGWYIASNEETLINTGYNQVYYALRGFWATTYDQAPSTIPSTPPPVPPVIKVNGSVVTTGFTINYTDGSVTFNLELQDADVVTASYTYQIPDQVRDAAIAQTLYYLRQRILNQQQIFPEIKRVQYGLQMWMMQDMDKLVMGMDGALCKAAADKLAMFERIGVAG